MSGTETGALADRLDALADDMMALAPRLADDFEGPYMELQAISLHHYAIHLRGLE